MIALCVSNKGQYPRGHGPTPSQTPMGILVLDLGKDIPVNGPSLWFWAVVILPLCGFGQHVSSIQHYPLMNLG